MDICLHKPSNTLHAGHKNAVLDVHWTNDGEKLLSASPDKTVRVWDTSTGQQTKKMTEHDNFVNSCSPLRRGPPLLCSGSDDGNVKVSYKLQCQKVLKELLLHAVPEQHGHQTQQCIQVWDMRVKRSVQTFTGKYQVLAVAFGDAGDQVCSGSHCCAASSSAQLPCICEFKVTSAHARGE